MRNTITRVVFLSVFLILSFSLFQNNPVYAGEGRCGYCCDGPGGIADNSKCWQRNNASDTRDYSCVYSPGGGCNNYCWNADACSSQPPPTNPPAPTTPPPTTLPPADIPTSAPAPTEPPQIEVPTIPPTQPPQDENRVTQEEFNTEVARCTTLPEGSTEDTATCLSNFYLEVKGSLGCSYVPGLQMHACVPDLATGECAIVCNVRDAAYPYEPPGAGGGNLVVATCTSGDLLCGLEGYWGFEEINSNPSTTQVPRANSVSGKPSLVDGQTLGESLGLVPSGRQSYTASAYEYVNYSISNTASARFNYQFNTYCPGTGCTDNLPAKNSPYLTTNSTGYPQRGTNGAFAISGWFYPFDQYGGTENYGRTIVDKHNATSSEYRLSFSDNTYSGNETLKLSVLIENQSGSQTTLTVEDTDYFHNSSSTWLGWSYFAAGYDNASNTLYLKFNNRSLVSKPVLAGYSLANVSDAVIDVGGNKNASNTSSVYFSDISLDEMGVWSRWLTPGEITTLQDCRDGNIPNTAVPKVGCLYPFDGSTPPTPTSTPPPTPTDPPPTDPPPTDPPPTDPPPTNPPPTDPPPTDPLSCTQYQLAQTFGGSAAGSGIGQFNDVEGIGIDPANDNVYVADAANHRIQKYNPSTNTWSVLVSGIQGTSTTPLYPIGIAVGANELYVTDTSAKKVQIFNKNTGSFISEFPTGAGNQGVAFTSIPAPYIYISDWWGGDPIGNRVLRYTASNNTLNASWPATGNSPGTGQGQFNQPLLMASDLSGNIYVADWMNARVQKFTSATNTWSTFVDGAVSGNYNLNRPEGVAVDAINNVYVVASQNKEVKKFNSSGQYVTAWPVPATGYQIPFGIGVTSTGHVYVGMGFGYNVFKFGCAY